MSTRGYIVGAVGIAMVAVSALTAMTTATAAEPAQVGRYSTVDEAVAMTPTSSYVVTMRGLLVGQVHNEQSDAGLIASGQSICAEIDGGLTWDSLAQGVRDRGLSVAFYRAYVQASVTAFCPEKESSL